MRSQSTALELHETTGASLQAFATSFVSPCFFQACYVGRSLHLIILAIAAQHQWIRFRIQLALKRGTRRHRHRLDLLLKHHRQLSHRPPRRGEEFADERKSKRGLRATTSASPAASPETRTAATASEEEMKPVKPYYLTSARGWNRRSRISFSWAARPVDIESRLHPHERFHLYAKGLLNS
jgi:hypothetical protein